MLEHHALLLLPPDAKGSRSIRAAKAPSQTLGFACRRDPEGIWSWLDYPVCEVHEEEDAPLLFTVRRRWTWPARFDVRDAEDVLVGSLVGRFVLNEFNRRIAERRRLSNCLVALYGPVEEPLATLEAGAAGLRVTFHAETERDPFVKMLLLAAALYERIHIAQGVRER